MVSAWVLIALAALGSGACAWGAVRLARAPKQSVAVPAAPSAPRARR